MAPSRMLLPRADTITPAFNPLLFNLIVSFLSLSMFGLVLVAVLFALKSYRIKRTRANSLPTYNETMNASRQSINVSACRPRPTSVLVYNEKHQLIAECESRPASPVPIPEIRITFPDEQDESGKRKSGRVMVVRVSEIGVGLEPLDQDDLPPYQKGQLHLQSFDTQRTGVIREKGPMA